MYEIVTPLPISLWNSEINICRPPTEKFTIDSYVTDLAI